MWILFFMHRRSKPPNISGSSRSTTETDSQHGLNFKISVHQVIPRRPWDPVGAQGLRLARNEYLRHRPRTCPARRSTSWLKPIWQAQRIFAGIVIPKMKGAKKKHVHVSKRKLWNCKIVPTTSLKKPDKSQRSTILEEAAEGHCNLQGPSWTTKRRSMLRSVRNVCGVRSERVGVHVYTPICTCM
jgi:hypothetical protein